MSLANAPRDAIDLLASLADLAEVVSAAGWTVNIAIETGAEAERLTFAAELNKTDHRGTE